MDSSTFTTSEAINSIQNNSSTRTPSQANSSQTNSSSAPSEENFKSSLSSSSVNFPQLVNEHHTPHSDEHISQSSNLPEQNTVTTIQLNLPDLLQNTKNNSCILNMFSPRLENEERKSDNGAVINKNGDVESKPLVSNIPINMKDSDNFSATTFSILNGHQLQSAQVNGHDTGGFIVANQNLAGIPQMTKQEEGSSSTKSVETSLKSVESKILETLIKLNEQLRNSINCSSSAFPSTPSSSMQMPSTSGISQGSGNQTLADNGNITSNNDNLPPVSIGACLMCGRECDGDCDSENEDKQLFLFPPPLSSEEVDSLFAKLKEQDKETAAEPAAVINTKMFLHQKQALNWMINKENCTDLGPFWREHGQHEWFNEGTKTYTDVRPTCIKGGILADDMGLGKTLTIIALIFTNHLNGKPMFIKKETTTGSSKKRRAFKTHTADNDEPKIKKPALDSSHDEEEVVIVKKEAREREKKAVAIKKRKEEIMNRKRVLEDKKGKDPGLKFRQIFLPKFLKNKDKQGNKVKKENIESSPVQKPITIDVTQPSTSKAHHDVSLVSDDDDDSSDELTVVDAAPSTPVRPNKLLTANPVPTGAAKTTLIICPLSVLSNWTDQICTHVNPAVNLHVYMYYGAQRIKDLKYLRRQDIVLTTYMTVANDFRTAQSSSPLHNVKWLRIVLDEGHTIRNRRTTLSKAVLELDAERRWVITGTPIQNRIDDLCTIILYLRMEPFNDYQWWKKSIENLCKKESDLADFRLSTLMKHVSIRRLKDDKVDNSKLVELPPKQVVIQDIELSGEERKFYDMLQHKGQSVIKRYLRHGCVIEHYGRCCAILMRLRQMCLHPRLCKEAIKELKQALDSAKDVDEAVDDGDDDGSQARLIKVLMDAISSGDSEECAICLESLNDPVVTPCAHVFCCACITDVLNTEELAPKCPMCRAPVDETDLLRVPEEQLNKNNETIDVDEDEEFKDSAKIRALISSLEAIRDKDPSIKSVVVSQFTSFLNIIEEYLEKHRFEYLRLDGSMKLDERLKALEDFNEPGSPATVFLLSMSAGGTGLNLTAASRVFLMDPAWNPAVEEQCFGRCHRMGQTKEVIITKYIVMDSVEERMLTLQEQKRQLMSQAFGAKAQSQEDRSRARVRNIAHLIGLRPAQQAANRGTKDLVCSEESIPLGEFDEGTDFEGEDPDKEEEEPFDHSAFLQIDETSDIHIPKQTKRVRQRIRMIVKEIDVDKDGKISEKELSDWIEKVMTKYLTSEGQRQMPKIDKDGDGLASWVEYSSAAGYTQGDIPEPKKSSEKSKQRDKEKFDLADTDKDGKLTNYELGVMIHPNEASQMSNIIVTEFLEVMDKDHDGQLSFKEFVGEDPSLPAIDKTTEQNMKQVFKELDLDQDSKLNNEELAEWLLPNNKPPHQNEAENLIRDIDDNKDGALSVEEIIKNYLKFATSRATRYGRMLKEEEPSLEDDEVIVKKTEGVGKQKEKMIEEKQENEAEKQQSGKMKEQKQEDEWDKLENKKEKRKPTDEL